MSLPPGVELVSDDRGVRCIRVGKASYGLRPDCRPQAVGYLSFDPGERWRNSALLSKVPRQFKRNRGTFETGIAQEVFNAMCAAWGKPEKSPGLRGGYTADGRKKLFAYLNESFRITNWMIGECLKTADPSALKLARRFSKQIRAEVYWAAIDHPRLAQLYQAWPALAFEAFHDGGALDMVRYGEPLDAIAEALDVPRSTRRLLPQCVAFNAAAHVCRIHPELVFQYMPKDWIRQLRFVKALHCVGDDQAAWFARKLPLDETNAVLEIEVPCIRDWMRAEGIHNPKMSWATAKERSDKWHVAEVVRAHERVFRRLEKERLEAEKPFSAPWIPAHVDGEYEIVPLTSQAMLDEEGAAMHHCVSSYGRIVRTGGSYIYSVRKGGERVATLELAKPWTHQEETVGYHPAQLRAHCNQDPDDATKNVVRAWVTKHNEIERRKMELASVGEWVASVPLSRR